MFTRIVDFIGTRGKTRELKEAIQTKILPILRGQPFHRTTIDYLPMSTPANAIRPSPRRTQKSHFLPVSCSTLYGCITALLRPIVRRIHAGPHVTSVPWDNPRCALCVRP